MGKTKRGKGTKLMALADSSGLPLSVCAASASPHEVTLVGEVLAGSFLSERPERLIGDRAYDSDPLDAEPPEGGIDMIAPHRRRGRRRPRTDASSDVTSEGGKSSASLPGYSTTAGVLPGTNTKKITSKPLSCSPAS